MSATIVDLLLTADTPVTCPHCAQSFNLDQGFARKALESFETSSRSAIAAVRESERRERDRLLQQQQHALLEQAQQSEQAAARQLADKNAQLKQLRDNELELRRQKQQLEDRAQSLEIEVLRRVDASRGEIETRVRVQEKQRSDLEKADLQKTIEDMKGKLAEAQAKAQQGSQQLQGEVLELVIEDALRRTFPLDGIEEIRKGQRGADVVQRVVTRSGQSAGAILWESKRARKWESDWTQKLKQDMGAASAAVGVLVTMPGAVPKDWEEGQCFGLVEDVWITTWSTALSVAEMLRVGLLDVYKERVIAAGKGEKMEAVYDYVTSPQFAQKIRAVHDAFKRMREELESEKNTTQQRWARREKQIGAAQAALVGVAGDVQGLSQQLLPMLELEADGA
jgi:hypothetical protein